MRQQFQLHGDDEDSLGRNKQHRPNRDGFPDNAKRRRGLNRK